jgi:YD repeat-containing protein
MFTRSILLLLSVTFIFSCKKFKDPEISYLVKTKTSAQTGNTETYTYDSENRIIRITNSNNTNFTTFSYIADTVFEYAHYNDDSTISSKYLLNPKKLKAEWLQPYFDRIICCESDKFEYDNADFLKYYTFSETDYSTNDTLENNGTNITQRKGAFSGLIGYGNFTTIYSYYDNSSTISNKNFGEPFLGKDYENLLKSETTSSTNLFQVPVTTVTTVKNYTYDFDNYGRVAAQYAITDASTIKTTFTYY